MKLTCARLWAQNLYILTLHGYHVRNKVQKFRRIFKVENWLSLTLSNFNVSTNVRLGIFPSRGRNLFENQLLKNFKNFKNIFVDFWGRVYLFSE